MKTYPITHYEYILRDPKKYLGYDINQFINLMGFKEFDFLDFKKMAEQNEMFRYFFINSAGKYDNTQGNMAIRMIYHALRLKTYGEKIYYISREVCDLLLDTRLTIDAEFLESPFKEIYLYTDQDHFKIKDSTGSMPMKGVYISLQVESDGKKKLRFFVTSGANGIDEMKDVNYHACFVIPNDGGDLKEICDHNLKKYNHKLSDSGYKIEDETLSDIFRFCVNALIYIGCRNANLSHIIPLSLQRAIAGKKSPGKIKKIERRLEKSAQCPFIYVTHNWGEKEDREARRDGRKLDHEVLVSGHWRGVWVGSKSDGTRRSEVRRIASYIKGLGKEKSNKKFVVN